MIWKMKGKIPSKEDSCPKACGWSSAWFLHPNEEGVVMGDFLQTHRTRFHKFRWIYHWKTAAKKDRVSLPLLGAGWVRRLAGFFKCALLLVWNLLNYTVNSETNKKNQYWSAIKFPFGTQVPIIGGSSHRNSWGGRDFMAGEAPFL